jgi:hypothetical protein
VEFGFLKLWEQNDDAMTDAELHELHANFNLTIWTTVGPQPLALDYQIMLIFPFCGYLFLFSFTVFIAENLYARRRILITRICSWIRDIVRRHGRLVRLKKPGN